MRNKGYSDYGGERIGKVLYLEHLRQRQAMLDLAETLDTPHERRVLLYLRNSCRPLSLGVSPINAVYRNRMSALY
jgi:hypothetical protein